MNESNVFQSKINSIDLPTLSVCLVDLLLLFRQLSLRTLSSSVQSLSHAQLLFAASSWRCSSPLSRALKLSYSSSQYAIIELCLSFLITTAAPSVFPSSRVFSYWVVSSSGGQSTGLHLKYLLFNDCPVVSFKLTGLISALSKKGIFSLRRGYNLMIPVPPEVLSAEVD